MAAVEIPQADQYSRSRVDISIAVSLVMLLLIVLLGYLTHRYGPKIPSSYFTDYPRHHSQKTSLWEKDIENRIPDTIPIVRYDSSLQPTEPPKPVVKTHRLGWCTILLRRENQTSAGGGQTAIQSRHDLADVARPEENNDGAELSGLSLRNPDNLPFAEAHTTTKTKHQPKNCCSICTEGFQKGENVRILPCSHIYHRRCIDPWLLDFARTTCPLCRKSLPILASSSMTPAVVEAPERAHIFGHGFNTTYSPSYL